MLAKEKKFLLLVLLLVVVVVVVVLFVVVVIVNCCYSTEIHWLTLSLRLIQLVRNGNCQLVRVLESSFFLLKHKLPKN